MDSKTKTVRLIIDKMKMIMNKSLDRGNYEKAMAAVSAGCGLLYNFNQKYTDSDFEGAVIKIAQHYKKSFEDGLNRYSPDNNTVLFFDGFGFDSRGVSRIYLNALIKNNYHVIYVSPLNTADRMPKTEELIKGHNVNWNHIDTKKCYNYRTTELMHIILDTSPKSMFFYTAPNDVSSAVAFAVMDGLVDRFLIDLTDHAFWLGVSSNDYFTGSRDISASNLLYERHVEKSKIIKLGGSILPDDSWHDHSGLPFDVTNERYVFSGGSLYKTLGDPDKTYYRIVEHMLANHSDVLFLYAGSGDTRELQQLIDKYPGRVYRIDERPDYYYLIQNCVLYLNTYPMFGGMMMKYSAYAGKLPITLKHEDDSEGLLIDQEHRRIEYSTYDELIADLDMLLTDEKYLKEREALLKGSIVSEDDFIIDVRDTIENYKTRSDHNYTRIDTSKFRQEFFDRFNIDVAKSQISSLNNRSLFIECPWMAIRLIKKIPEKIIKKARRRD